MAKKNKRGFRRNPGISGGPKSAKILYVNQGKSVPEPRAGTPERYRTRRPSNRGLQTDGPLTRPWLQSHRISLNCDFGLRESLRKLDVSQGRVAAARS